MALALFDLDNTLVDRTAAFGRAVPWLAERYGLDPAVAVPFIVDADGDGMVGWETWMAHTIERFEIDTTVDEMRAAFNERYLSGYELEPDVADGLRRMRSAGWRIGIVTNGPPSQNDKITRTGLDQLIDGWAVSEDVGARKPDRRIFEVAAERCGSVLAGGWMVGDSAPADMVGAHEAGLTSVWLHRGRTWSSAGAMADPYELANGLPRTTPIAAFEPHHQADDPVAAIELILTTS
jgi:HAD superfamily hydrolase (TIGR01549 family)